MAAKEEAIGGTGILLEKLEADRALRPIKHILKTGIGTDCSTGPFPSSVSIRPSQFMV